MSDGGAIPRGVGKRLARLAFELAETELESAAGVWPDGVMAGTTSTSDVPAPETARLVFWLPPEEAARVFGVATAELTRRVRAGEVQMRAKVAGGELVATLCSTDLVRCFGEPKVPTSTPTSMQASLPNPFGRPADSNRPFSAPRGAAPSKNRREPAAPPQPAATPMAPDASAIAAQSAEDEARHGRLVQAEERVRVLELHTARLEGRLETAGSVERGLQRYADKLEAKLEDAETLRLNLARAVGQLEAEVARLQGRLELAEAEPPRLIEAPSPPKDGARRDREPKKRGWFRRRR